MSLKNHPHQIGTYVLKLKKSNTRPLYAGGSLIIGQDQDGKPGAGAFDPLFDKKQVFSGQVTQVEIWNTILTQSEIESMAHCTKSTVQSKNRVVSWESDTWSSHGKATFKDVPLKDLCKRNIISNQFIWPRSISYEDMSRYCDIMGGIPPFTNQNGKNGKMEKWEQIYEDTSALFKSVNASFPSSFLDKDKDRRVNGKLSQTGMQCFSENDDLSFWTGITRNAMTGIWSTKYNPTLDFSNIKLDTPSETWNCAYFKFGKLHSTTCNDINPCGTFKISQSTVLYLKGLCTSDLEHFDTKYYIYGVKNNRPHFK